MSLIEQDSGFRGYLKDRWRASVKDADCWLYLAVHAEQDGDAQRAELYLKRASIREAQAHEFADELSRLGEGQ